MSLNITNKTKEILIIIIAAILTLLSFITEGFLLLLEYIFRGIDKCLSICKHTRQYKKGSR